ncbi:MAG: divergent polysaccharide deacetylase family protein [Candidatus Omnitrophica bacterium]|nr:divergent polysaccharide deacetylase family protein [Candidatus Omnitrophota bacterium]
MNRFLKVFFFLSVIAIPVLLFRPSGNTPKNSPSDFLADFTADNDEQPLEDNKEMPYGRGQIAIIFDDMGGSLDELRDLYSLNIPLTISVIPDLKFSRNIAHIGARCGFSVFIHLPLEPEDQKKQESAGFKFITTSMSRREAESLLRQYLNSIRIAIGVNNHMGSKATQDRRLSEIVIKAVKAKGLIFVDSQTSLESVTYSVARSEGLVCDYSRGFLDSGQDYHSMHEKMKQFIAESQKKGKIIIIAHPRKNTIKFLKENLPEFEREVDFITAREYFGI